MTTAMLFFLLAQLIDEPQQARRSFWTAKAFHGYISDTYQAFLDEADKSISLFVKMKKNY